MSGEEPLAEVPDDDIIIHAIRRSQVVREGRDALVHELLGSDVSSADLERRTWELAGQLVGENPDAGFDFWTVSAFIAATAIIGAIEMRRLSDKPGLVM